MIFKRKEKKTASKTNKSAEKVSLPDDSTTSSIEDFNNTVENSFFYTSDKKINSIDDIEIMRKLLSKYPDFNQQNKDTMLRKIFLNMLDDIKFIQSILKYYNLTIHEFFKIVYKQYPSLFNALFINKVKSSLAKNKYADI